MMNKAAPSALLPLAALACVLAMTPAATTEARQIGDVTVISNGPWTPAHDGSFMYCSARLRRQEGSRVNFHTVVANTADLCNSQANWMISQGWSYNATSGSGQCSCGDGFYGHMTVTGNSGGPLGEAALSDAGETLYHDGLRELRERYNISEFAQEHDMLLDAIRAAEPPQE